MPTQVALPHDIIDRFTHSLSLCIHSTSDLRATSLVSHAWLEPAQRYLFSHIAVYSNNDSVQYPSHVYHLRLAFLASRPDLARFVRSVDCLNAGFASSDLPWLNRDKVLDTFPNVTAFKLLAFPDVVRDGIPMLLSHWSQLRHLSITTTRPWSEAEYKPLPRPKTLFTLNISSINFVAWKSIVMVDMLRYLAQTSARDTLESARLVYMEQHPYDEEEDARMSLFAASIQEVNLFHHLSMLELQMMPDIPLWAPYTGGTPLAYITALCIHALTSLRIRVEEPGVCTYTVLRQLLQTAMCPNLDALTITFSMKPHNVEVLHVFPLAVETDAPTGVLSAESLDTQHQPIFEVDLAKRLSIFKIVLCPNRFRSRSVVLHDTTAFLRLFGRSRADALAVVKCRDPLQFLD